MVDFRFTAFETKLNFVPVNSFKRFLVGKEGRKKIWLSEGRWPPAFAGIATRTSFGKKRLCRLIRLGIVLWPENPCLQSYVEPIQLIRKLEPSAILYM